MPDKVKILYDTVSKDYNVGSLEDFQIKLQDDVKRKAFYDGVGSEFELGDFNTFSSKVKKKDISQPDFQFGSQTSPFGSKPSQTQVDTKVPSVLTPEYREEYKSQVAIDTQKKKDLSKQLQSAKDVYYQSQGDATSFSLYDGYQSSLKRIDDEISKNYPDEATVSRTVSGQEDFEKYKVKRDQLLVDRNKLNELSKETLKYINPKIESDIDSDLKKNGLDKFTRVNSSGVKVPDEYKIDDYAKTYAEQSGISNDGTFKKLVYDKLKSSVSSNIIKPEIEKEFNKLYKNKTGLTLDESIQKDALNNFIEGKNIQSNLILQVESLNKEIKTKLDESAKSLSSEYKPILDSINTDYKIQTDEIKSKIQQLNESYKAGLISRQDYELAFTNTKAEFDLADERYRQLFDAESKKYLNNQNELFSKYNKRFNRQVSEFKSIADQQLSDASSKYGKDYKMSPELKSQLESIYGEATKNFLSKEEAVKYELDRSSLINNIGGQFAKNLFIGLGGGIKSISSLYDFDAGYVLGDYMENSFTSSSPEIKSGWDLLDPIKLQSSTGKMIGGMAPILASSALTAAVTKNAPTAIRLLTTGLANYLVETAQIGGGVKDQVFQKTGNIADANKAAKKVMDANLYLLPLYALDGLPFLGNVTLGIKNTFARAGAKALIETATELPQEYFQGVFEELAVADRPISQTFEEMSLERFENTALNVIPTSVLLGGGGTAIQGVRESISKFQGRSLAAKVDLADLTETTKKQFIYDTVLRRGDVFSKAYVSSLFNSGNINEQEMESFSKMIEDSANIMAESKKIGLNKAQSKVYAALRFDYLQSKNEFDSEQDEVSKKVYKAKMDSAEKSLNTYLSGGKPDAVLLTLANNEQYIYSFETLNSIINEGGEILNQIVNGEVSIGLLSDKTNPKAKALSDKLIQLKQDAVQEKTVQPTQEDAIITPEGFTNRVFESNMQLGEAPIDSHISEEGYNYRVLSQKEINAISESGGVFAREGKQKGGNKNTKYWTKGNNKNWYGDQDNLETIRVKQDSFKENEVVRAENVEVYNKETKKFEPLIKQKFSTTGNVISQQAKPKPKVEGVTEEGFQEEVTPEQYVQDLQDTKQSNPEEYWSVDDVSVDDAKKGTIIKEDGGYGLVSKAGDIKGVFKGLGTKAKNVADKILQKAVSLGGTKLDNFDTYLTKIYERNGFKVVSRIPFNEEFAPPGWNKEKHGTPDVVAMVYDPDNKLNIKEKSFTDYDKAIAYRDRYAKKVKENYPVKEAPKELDAEVEKLYALLGTPSGEPRFRLSEETEEDLTGDIEAIEQEMNNMDEVELNFTEPQVSQKGLKVDPVSESNSLVKIAKKISNALLKPIQFFNGIPMITGMSDMLSAGKIKDSSGKTMDVEGGLLFNVLGKNKNAAWAGVTKEGAQAQYDNAVKLYNSNKELFDRLWSEGKLPDGHIPMAIMRMADTAVNSNEAIFRWVLPTIESLPKQNKINAMQAFIGSVQEKLNTKSKADIASATNILNFIKDKNITSLDQFFKEVILDSKKRSKGIPGSQLKLDNRSLIYDLIFAPKGIKTASKPTVKALLSGTDNSKNKIFTSDVIYSSIGEPSMLKSKQGEVVSVVGIDVKNGGVIAVDHGNYGFGPKGKTIALIENPTHGINVFPEWKAKSSRVFKKDKAGKVPSSESVATQTGGAFFTDKAMRGAKVFADVISDINLLIGKIRFAFPSVSVSITQEEFNNIINSPDVRTQVSDGKIILGLTKDGKISLNPEMSSLQTPIHEFGHIWIDFLRSKESGKKGTDFLNKGLDLVRNTKEHKKAIEKYGDTDIALEEALVELMANKGATIISAAQRSKFKSWMNGVFKYIQDKFTTFKDLDASKISKIKLDDFINTGLADLFSGKEVSAKFAPELSESAFKARMSAITNINEIVKIGLDNGISKDAITKVLRDKKFTEKEISGAIDKAVSKPVKLNESNLESAIELLDDIEDNKRKAERASSKRKTELDEKITEAQTELDKISEEAQIVKAINDNFDKIKKDLKEQGLLNVKC